MTCGLERECEFAAYKILYSCLMTGPSDSGLASFMNSLSAAHKADSAVQHALAVRSALLTTNFDKFFTLWIQAPNMSAYIIDPLADSMRQRSARILVSAYRPSLSLEHITRALAFDRTEDSDDNAAAAASSSSARVAPLPSHLRSCKAYLDSKFVDAYGLPLFAWQKELPADGLGAPKYSIDCKTTHERLAPSNAAHRQPINSGRARHTVSSSAASASAAAMSPSHAPIAPQHDVGQWIKKDLSGTVKLGAIEGSPSIKGGKLSGAGAAGGTGQPKLSMPRMSLAALSASNGSPLSSPSPSPSPPLMHSSLSFARAGSAAAAASASSKSGSSPMDLADDPVSRKRRNSQPLSSMSYHELESEIRAAEAVLLDQRAKVSSRRACKRPSTLLNPTPRNEETRRKHRESRLGDH